MCGGRSEAIDTQIALTKFALAAFVAVGGGHGGANKQMSECGQPEQCTRLDEEDECGEESSGVLQLLGV